MNYWLAKSEPEAFSWHDLVRDGVARWDGVRNYAARNHLRAMQLGDLCFFYHSVTGVEVVGVMRVVRTAYPDPTAPDAERDRWSCVDFAPLCPLATPVPLRVIKQTPCLANMALLRQSRLSVTPVTPEEFAILLSLGNTVLDF